MAPSYPPRHHAAVRASRRVATVVVGVAGAVLAGLAWGVPHLPPVFAATVAALCLLAALGSVLSWIDTVRHVAVVPYFERAVGGTATFGHGRGLARHLGRLDDAARAAGWLPLTAFGLADDLCGEDLVWHDPADLLATVLALRADPPDPETDDDLRRVAAKLARAREQGIRVCLLLRHGNATSGHEWAVRRGTVF